MTGQTSKTYPATGVAHQVRTPAPTFCLWKMGRQGGRVILTRGKLAYYPKSKGPQKGGNEPLRPRIIRRQPRHLCRNKTPSFGDVKAKDITKRIIDNLEATTDEQERLFSLKALANTLSPEILPVLEPYFTSESPDKRAASVRALRGFSDEILPSS